MSYPVTLTIDHPDSLSRGLLILKVLFGWLYVGIPHGIILCFYSLAVGIVTFIAFWAILFTGKYPRGMYNFVVGYVRWTSNVAAYYSFLLLDEYPPFTGEQTSHPLTLDVEYPEKLSRGLLILKVLFGWLYVGIPHGIILYFYGIVVGVVTFLAFWAVLFTGKYPLGMYNLTVGYMRWYVNVNTYMLLLRDEYPPFGG